MHGESVPLTECVGTSWRNLPFILAVMTCLGPEGLGRLGVRGGETRSLGRVPPLVHPRSRAFWEYGMKQSLVRTVVASTVALMASMALSTGPAAAADNTLGWLRMTPAKGPTSKAVDVLAQGSCPGGNAILVKMTGPGIPESPEVGMIVGNTLVSALPKTESGQLYVPLSLTFDGWFARNVPGAKPNGTYTITLICRDSVRGSQRFGNYVGTVAIANGTFTALGESAKPLDTKKLANDPYGVQQPSSAPTPGAVAPSAGASSAAPSAGSSTSPSAAPSAATTTQPSASATGDDPSQGTDAEAGSIVQPVAATSDSGSATRTFLLGLGAVLLIAVGVRAYALRRRGPGVPAGSHAANDDVLDSVGDPR